MGDPYASEREYSAEKAEISPYYSFETGFRYSPAPPEGATEFPPEKSLFHAALHNKLWV